MNKNLIVIACTSSALTKLQSLGAPFSCWLHFDRTKLGDLPEVIRTLVNAGCVEIFVSGIGAAAVHDAIDNLLMDMGGADVVTIWQTEGLAEMAWEFLNVDFTPTNVDINVIAAFADEPQLELGRIAEIITILGDAITNEK